MNDLKSIQAQIKDIITKLSKSLSNEDLACGWREQSREAMLKFFKTMFEDLEKNPPRIKIEYMTIARGLDHWGIDGGRLEEQAIKISRQVSLYEKKHQGVFVKLINFIKRKD